MASGLGSAASAKEACEAGETGAEEEEGGGLRGGGVGGYGGCEALGEDGVRGGGGVDVVEEEIAGAVGQGGWVLEAVAGGIAEAIKAGVLKNGVEEGVGVEEDGAGGQRTRECGVEGVGVGGCSRVACELGRFSQVGEVGYEDAGSAIEFKRSDDAIDVGGGGLGGGLTLRNGRVGKGLEIVGAAPYDEEGRGDGAGRQ